MIDHIGFKVSDFAASKAFYERVLAPLGYGLVMEVTPALTRGTPASVSARSLTSGSVGRVPMPTTPRAACT